MWLSDKQLMKKMTTYLFLTLGLLSSTGCMQPTVFTDDDAAFEYREIYLPENGSKEAQKLGLNNVDVDWGIWGHNLSVVLPDDPSMAVYATVDGHPNQEQFCFSSDRLYKYIEHYIVDNFGERHTTRFAIMPRDNNISCLCEQCVAKGCTYNDASPAVFSMIERLAQRFPNHFFFTSYYLTTRSLPLKPMPDNAGVLFSAIHYDLCTKATTREEETETLLAKWSKMTSHLYVWDYINNFDDYFTPFPVFTVMQRRFQLYKRAGVTGLFLNGSGTDFSTFSHIRTHILAALMHDPDADWQTLLQEKCEELYPVAGSAIARFMLSQEDFVKERGKMLPIYEGVAQSRKTYLDEEAFGKFHEELLRLLPEAKKAEQDELTSMAQAMMLTRLEIMRLDGHPTGCKPLLDQLAELPKKGIRIYSESYWTIDDYVNEYTSMWQTYESSHKKNLLLGKQLSPLSKLDEDYGDISILTDGLAGIPSNYHCGQLIFSAGTALKIAIPHVQGLKHLRIGLTSNRHFHIALPASISLHSGGQEIASQQPLPTSGLPQRVVVEFDIPSNAGGTLILTLVRNEEERTMAIDEIEGF